MNGSSCGDGATACPHAQPDHDPGYEIDRQSARQRQTGETERDQHCDKPGDGSEFIGGRSPSRAGLGDLVL